MAIPAYQQRTLIRVVNASAETLGNTPRFFRDMFFPSGTPIDTEFVEIQETLKKSGMSEFRYIDQPAAIVGKSGGTSRIFRAPFISEKTNWTAKELLELEQQDDVLRLNNETKDQARQRKIKETAIVLKDRATAREEWLCINTLSGGWSYTSDEGVHYNADFSFANEFKPVLTSTARWGQSAADIEGNLTTWGNLSTDEVGGNITTIVYGRNAAREFRKDEAIRADFDNINVRAGQLDLAFGKQLFSTYKGINHYEVSEKVRLADGTVVDLVDPNKIWLISDAMETDYVYGPIPQIDDQGNPIAARLPYFAKQWTEGEDNPVMWTLLQSRPFPIICNPGSVVVATVM